MSIVALAAVTLLQVNAGPGLLAKHAASLTNAKSMTVDFTVERLPAAPENYHLVYSKPNMLRIEYPGGMIMTDGTTLWEYDKAKNEYLEGPGDLASLSKKIQSNEYYAWAAFFFPDQLKGVKDATAGRKISMKGTPVTTVDFTIDASRSLTSTFYIDEKMGVARAASVKAARGGDSVETLVKADKIELSDQVAETSLFAFSPPAGSKKVEIAAGDLAKWYEDLDEGLKVAKATNRMVFVDFGAEW
jgi:outer membrane lipoprotein-sorting protein